MGRVYDATWGRFFSAFYDKLLEATEEAGLREMRRRTLSAASGRTLEIGAGTGANLGLYPEPVGELVLAEPDPHMTKRLRRHTAEQGVDAEIVEAPAERLPFPEASFDTAVFTLVLCTVPDPKAALAEAARVLKPGGKLLFLEHVRAREPRLATWQDRFARPWRFVNDGCNCNRDTAANLDASPFDVQNLEHERMPKAPPVVRPVIRGSAMAP